MFHPLSLVQFKWAVNQKIVLCFKKKPNIPGAEGDREANSQGHKHYQKCDHRGGCSILIICQTSFFMYFII